MVVVAKLCLSCGAGLPPDGLTCAWCGTAHLVRTDATLGLACGGCGAGNALDARTCVQCRAELRMRCPECAAASPLMSRFCQECGLGLRDWRRARRVALPDRVGSPEAAERLALEWLLDSWLRARDLEREVGFLERTLVWVPEWRFEARAVGRVQGQASQTHYRTVNRRHYDAETKTWQDRVDSEPYTVWQHVAKDFDQREVARRPANRAAAVYAPLLEATDVRAVHGDELEPGALPPGGRAFEPDLADEDVYDRLRSEVLARLRGSLLERVELLEVRLLGPARLELVWRPVWQVVYRYRRTHGHVHVDGHARRATGKRMTLLNQLFG